MKEAPKLTFELKFELSDLKLVDFGTKIIKIGQEMPILEYYVMHVQNPLHFNFDGIFALFNSPA